MFCRAMLLRNGHGIGHYSKTLIWRRWFPLHLWTLCFGSMCLTRAVNTSVPSLRLTEIDSGSASHTHLLCHRSLCHPLSQPSCDLWLCPRHHCPRDLNHPTHVTSHLCDVVLTFVMTSSCPRVSVTDSHHGAVGGGPSVAFQQFHQKLANISRK